MINYLKDTLIVLFNILFENYRIMSSSLYILGFDREVGLKLLKGTNFPKDVS